MKSDHIAEKVDDSKVMRALHQKRYKLHDLNLHKESTDVICFDFQQALPTSLITTSFFYLRRL